MLSNTAARLISVDNHTGPVWVVHRVSVVDREPVCKFVNDSFLHQVSLVSCRVASGLIVARQRLRPQRQVW